MLKKLKPDYYYPHILAIDLEELKNEGIKGIICDIDNTIVPYSEKNILKEVLDYLSEIKNKGIKLCLVSNGMEKRVDYFRQELQLPAIGQALKPSKRAFKQAQARLDLAPEEIAVIGDQLFTDILGGNRMGFQTILVNPLAEKEFISTKFLRLMEKIFFQRQDF